MSGEFDFPIDPPPPYLGYERRMLHLLVQNFGLHRMTHTFALLELSRPAYEEILQKLLSASYGHAIGSDGTIDMHGIGVALEPYAPIAAIPQQFQAAPAESGWLLENGDMRNVRYRKLDEFGMPDWTDNRDMALRFARRVDAEAFGENDEDAWMVREHFWPQPMQGTDISLNEVGELMHVTISTTGIKSEVLERLKEPGSGGTLSDGPGVSPPNELETKVRSAIAEHLQRNALETGNITVTCSISLGYQSHLDNDGKEKAQQTPVPTDATQGDASKG
jgi:hypothetical protein